MLSTRLPLMTLPEALFPHAHALNSRMLQDSGPCDRAGRERVWELRKSRLGEARRYLDGISDQ